MSVPECDRQQHTILSAPLRVPLYTTGSLDVKPEKWFSDVEPDADFGVLYSRDVPADSMLENLLFKLDPA
jgi:hypothetical protein